jgi:hypothetical protein
LGRKAALTNDGRRRISPEATTRSVSTSARKYSCVDRQRGRSSTKVPSKIAWRGAQRTMIVDSWLALLIIGDGLESATVLS